MPITIGRRPDHTFDEPLGLLSDCHRRIEHFLAVLIAVDRELGGGAPTARHRAELEAALRYFTTAAPRHTADEEESLFPRLRQSADPAAVQALETVALLELDHDDAERRHGSVDRLVRRWLDHDRLELDEARALRSHLTELQAIYERHIRVEDGELFPAAATVLSPAQIKEIGREMAQRRITPA
jgi:hemerythrin-like domain-containing protein